MATIGRFCQATCWPTYGQVPATGVRMATMSDLDPPRFKGGRMSNEPKFWMCWCPTRTAPTKRWDTLAEAKAEAARLAEGNRGTVYVLASVGAMEPTYPPVIWREIE